jgi:sugar lactone lactonase YvrE
MTRMFILASAVTAVALAACGDDANPQPDELALPGPAYYPESLNAAPDGTLYVGSLATGQVVAYRNGVDEPEIVVGATSGVTGVTGVLVHADELWICSIDTMFKKPTEVRSFGLDGTPHEAFPLAANQFCNDLAFDAAGNLYATDSFTGAVLRLPPNGTALEPWFSDASLVPAHQGAFGLDGIAAVDGALYINKLDTSGLYRVDIQANGAPGALTQIAVTPALASPDGMRALDDHTLLVIESGGALEKLTITGASATSVPLVRDLDQPTSVVVARGSAWVSEGQLGRLFAQPPQSPQLPFSVRRVPL